MINSCLPPRQRFHFVRGTCSSNPIRLRRKFSSRKLAYYRSYVFRTWFTNIPRYVNGPCDPFFPVGSKYACLRPLRYFQNLARCNFKVSNMLKYCTDIIEILERNRIYRMVEPWYLGKGTIFINLPISRTKWSFDRFIFQESAVVSDPDTRCSFLSFSSSLSFSLWILLIALVNEKDSTRRFDRSYHLTIDLFPSNSTFVRSTLDVNERRNERASKIDNWRRSFPWKSTYRKVLGSFIVPTLRNNRCWHVPRATYRRYRLTEASSFSRYA